jgi:hypothetical protein
MWGAMFFYTADEEVIFSKNIVKEQKVNLTNRSSCGLGCRRQPAHERLIRGSTLVPIPRIYFC